MAKKKVQTKPKTGKPTAARLPDHLAGLPHEIARARAFISEADDRLRHLADCLEPAIHEFSADDHPERLRAAATQIWANVVAAAGILLDLAVFIGRLEGLA
jgi:hypothetical protein